VEYVPLGGNADHPGLTCAAAPGRQFTEKQVMAIALAELAEAMVVVLRGDREACRENEAVLKQELKTAAEVVAPGIEGFRVRRVCCGKNCPATCRLRDSRMSLRP
jgi:hypothetical protein